ncbi:hypothetical protein COLO4_34564 [Corchorus olitorius]|uniref:Uncharacterized protein n=1 Tax=Corchorus olitorius TaxID=93759 RepID=A0A1R3GK83_9ROSI|nr:hypothetical protein COLO4_34564 [Corchorus olitorius]
MEEKEKLSEAEKKTKHKLPQVAGMHGSLIKGNKSELKNEIIGGFQYGAGTCSYLTVASSSCCSC